MQRYGKKLLVAMLGLFFSLAYAHAQEVGKISTLNGRVDVFTQNSQVALSARENDSMHVGDAIRTKSDSRAEVHFKDGSLVRLAPNSKVTIEEYKLANDSIRTSAKIKLERGKMRTIVAKMHDAAPFDIATPNTQGTIKGSDIFTSFEAGTSNMLVAQGQLSVINTTLPQNPVTINAGNSVTIPHDIAPLGPKPYLELERKLYEQDTSVSMLVKKDLNTNAVTAIVAKLSGIILITPKTETKSHPAKLNEIIKEGDRIETGKESTVQIQLDNDNALSLKPDTKLLILRLSINQQTGEYENLFEVTVGTVKARIENLKGNSKFEVKTPTAICGARGTIIYVQVLPNGFTTLAVEGGTGYIANSMSGDSRNVTGGTQSSSDTNGNVSDPQAMSDDQRGSLDDNTGSSGGSDNQSQGNDSSGFSLNSDTNNNQGSNDTSGTATDNTGVDIPITDTNPTEGNQEPAPIALDGSFSARFGDFNFSDRRPDIVHDKGTIDNATIAGSGNLSTDLAVSINADYDQTSKNPNQLWTSDTVDIATSDGGHMLGFTGGTKLGDELKGLMYVLYVKPNAGLWSVSPVESVLDGTFDPETQTILATGLMHLFNPGLDGFSLDQPTIVSADQLTYDSPYVINDDNPSYGKIDGTLQGSINVSTLKLVDQNWGLWKASAGGTVMDPDSNIDAVVGGTDQHSNLDGEGGYDAGGSYGQFGKSYWLGTIKSDHPLDDDPFTATLDGTILSDYGLGHFNGKMLGLYENGEVQRWQSVAGGVYTEIPLKTFGELKINFGYLSDGLLQFGNNDDSGSYDMPGLFGSINLPWSNNCSLTLMGDYANPGKNSLWLDDMFSGGTTDGGVFTGFIGGVRLNDNTLHGLANALYLRVLGNTQYEIGYLETLDLAGQAYPGLNLFKMTGNFTHHQKDSIDILKGKIPDIISSSIQIDSSTGFFSNNDLHQTASLYTQDAKGSVMQFLGLNWGIWNLVNIGEYEGSAAKNWELTSAANVTYDTHDPANLAGSILTQTTGTKGASGALTGTTNGICINIQKDGTLTGSVMNAKTTGNYIEVDDGAETPPVWQTVSVGKWEIANTNLSNTDLTTNICALSAAANMPTVTEVYSQLLKGVGQGGINSANVDMHLYATSATVPTGIWAALINGSYGEITSPTAWSINAGGVTLTGKGWSDGLWSANVSGAIDNKTVTGTAAGKYNDGSFNGAGAGTWKNEQSVAN